MNQQRSFRDHRNSRDVGDDLASSLLRVGGLQERGELCTDVPAGWLRCSDLLDEPERFGDWRDRLATWLVRNHGAAPERTAASYVMSWYLHVPAYVGALLLHHERRVPSLTPEQLAFGLGDDRPHPAGMAVLGEGFHCLPTDPGSARPEATVVADEHALAAVLRAQYVAHAARFVRAYAPGSRLGRRTLWAAATDALDNCLWWAGRQGGTPDAEGAGVADAALVLDARYRPLTSASTLRVAVDESGHRGWERRRESCCFSYLLPGESECGECPRICSR
ncbi:(2Fe-2S)-binding protein [Amycolatopsis sp. FDAARGOS 1241]|uniref:(2Fe-2S)-binding protein n=1 Tax=Amycolatopsis sp. FDAARGOS 1241 TaxID=2778070 RepID=UPI0019505A85|nr:(2Fe-2S)-binding protein [Amycolatopsis sp. FDAARGOS 1241]QRP46609.1 (2Fe-2S)-binding protein [Amycolatopsis sp. FDAARGOS 1241]